MAIQNLNSCLNFFRFLSCTPGTTFGTNSYSTMNIQNPNSCLIFFSLNFIFIFYTPQATFSAKSCSTWPFKTQVHARFYFIFFIFFLAPRKQLLTLVAWPLPFQTQAHVRICFSCFISLHPSNNS